MTREEVTNNRPSDYSNWRRNTNFGNVINVDDMLVRNGLWLESNYDNKVLCFIEDIQTERTIKNIDWETVVEEKDPHVPILRNISERSNIPTYVVYHNCWNLDHKFFKIFDITSEENILVNEDQYIDFIKNHNGKLNYFKQFRNKVGR